jgi:ABC-type branched-subunit amino acid transport system permease subunit
VRRGPFDPTLLWIAVAFVVLPFVMPGGTLDPNPFSPHRFFPPQHGFVDLATTILIFSLFALGFNLLFGHTGELSFGHAMFFAIGAYATALYAKGFSVALFGKTFSHGPGDNALVSLALAVVLVLLWSWLLGRLVVPRSSGIYYSMITLAFAQVVFFTAYKWSDLTGGEDGIQAISRPPLPGLGDYLRNSSEHMFAFTAVVAFVMVAAMSWVLRSPFGSVLHAIRENKQRARFLGYDVDKYRVNAFVLSALFPAVAGWLWTYYQQSINPDAGSVNYSGNVVMMSLLGGIHTFVGPMLGAFVYWELQNNVSHATKYWLAWIGGVFVLFVLVAPRGIWGGLEDLRHYGLQAALRRVFSREARVETETAEELPPVTPDATKEARDP